MDSKELAQLVDVPLSMLMMDFPNFPTNPNIEQAKKVVQFYAGYKEEKIPLNEPYIAEPSTSLKKHVPEMKEIVRALYDYSESIREKIMKDNKMKYLINNRGHYCIGIWKLAEIMFADGRKLFDIIQRLNDEHLAIMYRADSGKSYWFELDKYGKELIGKKE